jgi:hypothetical protein
MAKTALQQAVRAVNRAVREAKADKVGNRALKVRAVKGGRGRAGKAGKERAVRVSPEGRDKVRGRVEVNRAVRVKGKARAKVRAKVAPREVRRKVRGRVQMRERRSRADSKVRVRGKVRVNQRVNGYPERLHSNDSPANRAHPEGRASRVSRVREAEAISSGGVAASREAVKPAAVEI